MKRGGGVELHNPSTAAPGVLVSQCASRTNMDYLRSCAAQTAPIHVTHHLRRTDSLLTAVSLIRAMGDTAAVINWIQVDPSVQNHE